MADARLEVELGALKFVGEGSEKWVEQQWAKVAEFAQRTPVASIKEVKSSLASHSAEQPRKNKPSGSLAIFLKEKAVGNNQVKRFLATAVWLSDAGLKTLKTSDVSKALVDAHQKKTRQSGRHTESERV